MAGYRKAIGGMAVALVLAVSVGSALNGLLSTPGRHTAFRRGRRLVAGALTGAVVLGAVTPGIAAAAQSSQSKTRPSPVHVIAAHTLTTVRGDYTIDVPVGWDFRSGYAAGASTQPADYTEDPIIVTPMGQDEPAAFIYGMLSINGFKDLESQPSMSEAASNPDGFVQAFVQAEAESMSTRWSASESATIIAKLLATRAPDIRLVSVASQSATRATVRVRYSAQGRQLDDQWVITLAYVLNPAWTALIGAPAWDSFAFVSGCEAPVGSLDRVKPVCAHILASFHPNNAWLSSLVAQYIGHLDQQVQMVGHTVDTIAQMQYQEQMQMADPTYRVGYRWWQTLGNDVDLKNPDTGTIWWNTDAGYHYYCETPQRAIIGADDYSALREAPDCRTMLQKVDPLSS